VSNYPWLKVYVDQWHNLVKTQSAPHAILLSGAKGLAKAELAKMMAHIAVCEDLQESSVCNHCKGCHLFNSGNHTDVTIITAEKAVIKVDQIRQLSKDVVLSSTRNNYRVMIIEDAEKMNKASANALLKTLEEPPANVIIILTTSEIGYLLATIKSRCFKVNIKSNDRQLLIQWIQQNCTNSLDEINQAMLLSNDSPVDSLTILKDNKLTSVRFMLEDLDQLAKRQSGVLEISKKWLKEESLNNISLIAAYFLNVIKANNSLIEKSILNSLSHTNYANIQGLDKKILNFINKTYNIINRLKTPLKPELMLEELLISWQNDFVVNS